MHEPLTEKQTRCIEKCNLISGTVIEPCEETDKEGSVCDRTYQNCVEVCLEE